MRLTAQEEYGLRCLFHLAEVAPSDSVTIADIAERESLTTANVAKLMRLLREAGFVTSIRGQKGGYRLANRPDRILLSDVLEALGKRLYSPCFCEQHSGHSGECVHVDDCSIRALWSGLDRLVHAFLSKRTLSDLAGTERTLSRRIHRDMPGLLRLTRPSGRPALPSA
jgi:Rrf2 family protein